MRLSLLSSALALAGGVQVAALPQLGNPQNLAPALPLAEFNHTIIQPLTLEEALSGATPFNLNPLPPQPSENSSPKLLAAAATCSNPRIRTEWDSLSASGKSAFLNAVKCLIGKPASGQFSNARNRYEDLVALHQSLTPNVHGNAKFLIWHRYYIWTFEDILKQECGYSGNLPWFDEARYAGKFAQSSVFSSSNFGAVALGGGCVRDGAFAGLTCNIGPGSGNGAHCLARNNDDSKTVNTGSAMVNACNARSTYPDMAACAEGGAHAWGHNGIGAVMQDTYASPSDPVFWLHHGYIDRNFRIWQNAASGRSNSIDGTDRVGNRLTLSTSVSVNGLRPNVVIGDIIDTMGTKLCYKYNY
jgi:tyrosinase